MKKALALFMALVMICSVVATLSTVSATDAKAAPVLDGVISDGEYTYSVTTNVNDLSAGAASEVEGTEVVEYFAYNATYLYYGIVFTQTADNRACWPQLHVNNTFNVYNNDNADNADYHSRATLQARYLADGSTINNGIGAPKGGPTPSFERDMFVVGSKDQNNVKTYEFKFALSYIATTANCDVADVRVIPMWTFFHASTSTAHVLTSEDMLNMEDEGIGTIRDCGVGSNMYNFVVLDTTAKNEKYENLANKFGCVYYLGEPVAEEPTEEPDPFANIDLEDLYGATYVGKALTEEDAKPVLDGVINEGEYQAEYVITADGKDAIRFGVQALLLADYKQYVSHDDEYFYFAFDFYNANTGLRGRLYWNLSFIDSFDVEYYGGNTVNAAFKQNGHGLAEGWNLGAEVKANIAEGYSDRGSTVSFGTAPVKGTDYDVAVGKEDLAEPIDEEGNSTTHQVYEIKVSKDWYAAQVGLESAADVRELAWVALAGESNLYGSSYTQFGHYISDADLAKLNATGFTYTRPASSSHPYDNASLPFLFVLDEKPVFDEPYKNTAHKLGLNTYIGAPMEVSPVVDGVVNPGEYSYCRTWAPEEILNYSAEIQSGVVEYIAHDAEYIYYANVVTQANNNRAFQFQFNPLNTHAIFNSKDNLKNTLFQRVTWQLRYQDDGTTTLAQNPTWNYAQSEALPEVGEGLDIEYAATKTEGNIKTYELKLKKAYIAGYAGCEVEDVSVLPYMTYYHSGPALAHNYSQADANAFLALGATRADTGLIYRFIVLEEAPEGCEVAVEDNLDVATKDAASVRLSTTRSGLRFTTTVNTAEFAALVAKYGVENVKVGTLIAPQDKLDEALTIDTATKIDVVASIEHPFAQNAISTTFAGSITNIKPQNLTRDFTAVGYVAYSADGENWTYVYSETTCTRNVTEIAQAAVDAGEFAEDADALEILQNLGAVVA